MNAGVCGGNRQAIPCTLLNSSSDLSIRKVFYLQADNGGSDGLYFRCLVFSYQQSPQEAASVTTKVSSHCSQRTIVRRLTIISRGFRGSNFRRPHQGIDRGFRLTAVAGIPRVWHLGRHVCRERAYISRQRPSSEATCIISRAVESANRERLISQQTEMCVEILGYPDRFQPLTYMS
jgi:hypothetical protein